MLVLIDIKLILKKFYKDYKLAIFKKVSFKVVPTRAIRNFFKSPMGI